MSISRAPLHILNLQVRIIIYVRLWSGELVVVVDWGLLCLGWWVCAPGLGGSCPLCSRCGGWYPVPNAVQGVLGFHIL
jgi:hypothetical protein